MKINPKFNTVVNILCLTSIVGGIGGCIEGNNKYKQAIAAGVGYYDTDKKFHWRTNQEFAERPPVDAIQLYAERLDRAMSLYSRLFELNQLQFTDILNKLDRVLDKQTSPIQPPTLEHVTPYLIATNTLEINKFNPQWYTPSLTNGTYR